MPRRVIETDSSSSTTRIRSDVIPTSSRRAWPALSRSSASIGRTLASTRSAGTSIPWRALAARLTSPTNLGTLAATYMPGTAFPHDTREAATDCRRRSMERPMFAVVMRFQFQRPPNGDLQRTLEDIADQLGHFPGFYAHYGFFPTATEAVTTHVWES